MSVVFKTAPFKTSGGTTARSLDGWFGDVINVKEMGAVGDNSADDTDAIQAAFDLAFGSSASPHGYDNRHLNRPVFFPAGIYKTTDTLTLTRVVGGHIYGAGHHSVQIRLTAVAAPGPLWPLLHINGAANLCLEKMTLTHLGLGGSWTGTNSCCINLDWDGVAGATGNDGLHANHFQDLTIGGGNHCVIIADSDNEGHDNLFMHCTVNGGSFGDAHGNVTGYDVRGSAALNNLSITGGGNAEVAWMRCPSGGGSMSAFSSSLASPGPSDADFVMESGQTMLISGVRTEAERVLRMENGIVTMQGVTGSSGTTVFAEINGGKCTIQGCRPGGTSAEIIGTGGQLYIAAVYNEATTPLSGYSGTKVWNPDGLT